ncbi:MULTISPECIES: SWF or SNF family helicase [unclassified Streptomyces]|uniref:SWF or SNF family helicase n=1 Tax=unclassified Streptomyces TaxID=2593676 RepID=UPI002E3700E8|nr:SWF or SNF family helicase [Streptomyces sp. NBC_01268]
MSEYGTEDERTFAALPSVQGSAFARTWWGRAWLQALEDTALDGQQLKQGRRHARAGAVGAVSVRPGRITAVVQDRDGTAYRSDVLLQELSGAEWDRLLDLAVDSAGHIAALLDREMPPHLVEDAAAAGLELLPGVGDLEPECGCDAWDHCPHTAALCYQVARLLDEDPFVLLLMRGRGERALLDALQERSAARAVGAEGPEGVGGPGAPGWSGDSGVSALAGSVGGSGGSHAAAVPAEEAFAAGGILPPLPDLPFPPAAAGEPPSLDTENGPEPGIDPVALEFLAGDAAARALRMLAGALDDAPLSPSQDAVRLAAGDPVPWIAARLAEGSGRGRTELDLAVRAWRYGGAAALEVLEEERVPAPEVLVRAGAQLAEAWEDGERPELRPVGAARWTVAAADAQLRLGVDGRWWPYRKERGRWTPAGPAEQDPAAALAAVAAP